MDFKRLPALMATALALFVMAALPAGASAADLVISTPQTFGDLDGSPDDADGIADGTFTVDGDLVLDSSGSIDCSDGAPLPAGTGACGIQLVVTGNAILLPGSAIKAENANGAGDGGNVSLDVGAELAASGAISSSKTSTTGSGNAGAIDIGAGGDVFAGSTSAIVAKSANGRGGAISIDAQNVTAAGPIESAGAQPGSPTSPDGGQIAVNGLCSVLVGTAGRITSVGGTGGADLVHVQGGCDVLLRGLVASTSSGATGAADNHCSDQTTTTKTTTSTGDYRSKSTYKQSYGNYSYGHNHPKPAPPPPPAQQSHAPGCVEVWSKGALAIDHTDGSAGEVSADLGPAVAAMTATATRKTGTTHGGKGACSSKPPTTSVGVSARIDLYARSDIGIIAGPAGTFAVHANDGRGDNVTAGNITAKSAEGAVFATGPSVQADGNGEGSDGGKIVLEGAIAAELPDAALAARGDDNATGGYGNGGNISIRSYDDAVTWTGGNGDVSPTGSGVAAANRGTISISYCTAIDTSGTSFPAIGTATAPTSAQACGGAPSIPSNVAI